jgi:PAS domain S-box-containing protein
MLGYDEKTLSKKHFSDITHPDDVPASRDLVQRLLDGERRTERIEKRYIGAEGEVLWADVSTTLHRDETGRPVHFITDVYDITLRKKAEEALKEKIRELQKFNELTVDRELRMIELKREINDLLKKAGEQEKYRIAE